jgi:hypothetical protein
MIILLFVLIAILAVLIFFYVRAMADVKKARKEALAHLESCNIRFDNHRVAILEMQDRLRELNSENSLALLSLLKKVDRKANTVFRILVIFFILLFIVVYSYS